MKDLEYHILLERIRKLEIRYNKLSKSYYGHIANKTNCGKDERKM